VIRLAGQEDECSRDPVMHEEIIADYTDMIYAAARQEIEARRQAFIRKWRLKHRAVADSASLASSQIDMRKVARWRMLETKPIAQPIDLAG
jgi:hypothetical protein